MKRSMFLKSLLSLFLAMTTLTAVFVGCSDQSDQSDQTDHKDETTTPTKQEDKAPETDRDFPKPEDSDEDLSVGNYVDVSQIDSKYLQKSGSTTLVDVTAPQFEIGGITHPSQNGGEFYRLDVTKKSTYSSKNASLATNTPGVTVRFRTNADRIYLYATIRDSKTTYQHFTDRGVFGFDVYVGSGTNRIYLDGQGLLTNSASLKNQEIVLPGGYQEVTINLPLYAGVKKVQIGFPSGAMIAPPTQRTYKPICFYGTSITQGGCVSRPGNAYSNIICRMLNADNKNLGFSGSGKGEQSVAKYIANSDISALVMDNLNISSNEEFEKMFYPFYETVRKAHPDIPIVMVYVSSFYPATPEDLNASGKDEFAMELGREKAVKEAYNKAVENGDENVYYVSAGEYFNRELADLYSVDGVHPNDLGHYFYAKAIFDVLEPALQKSYPKA